MPVGFHYATMGSPPMCTTVIENEFAARFQVIQRGALIYTSEYPEIINVSALDSHFDCHLRIETKFE